MLHKLPLNVGLLALAPLASLTAQEVPKPAKKEIILKKRAHQKGDKIVSSGRHDHSHEISISAMGTEVGSYTESQRSMSFAVEVLEVNQAGVVKKVKAAITKWTRSQKSEISSGSSTESGLSDLQAGLIDVPFVLDTSSTPASVTDAKGEAMATDRADVIRKAMLNATGRLKALENPADKLVPNRVKIGDTIALDDKQCAALMSLDREKAPGGLAGEPPSLSGTLTFKETRSLLGKKVAVFDIALESKATTMGMSMNSKPKGELLIGIDDRYLYRLLIKGEAKLSGDVSDLLPEEAGEIDVDANGEGDTTIKQDRIYQNAK